MKIEIVSIIGAGLMGSAIAQVIANSGFRVTLCSRKGKNGLNKLNEGVKKAVTRKNLNEEQAALLLSRVTCTSLLSEAVVEADLVIEAVIEDLEIKRAVFREIDTNCKQHTLIASNTSSLNICSLAEATKRADKVIGMHFFNPAPVMKLVEVIPTPQTSDETVRSITSFSKEIGKVPLIVQNSPGFVVNRVLMPAINAAAFVLMDKVAPAETIDAAMKLGANYPMGPLELADLVGIDVCLRIMKELNARLEDSTYQICPLFEEMVAKGHLGRKTGKGFYTYKIQ